MPIMILHTYMDYILRELIDKNYPVMLGFLLFGDKVLRTQKNLHYGMILEQRFLVLFRMHLSGMIPRYSYPSHNQGFFRFMKGFGRFICMGRYFTMNPIMTSDSDGQSRNFHKSCPWYHHNYYHYPCKPVVAL